MFIQKHIKWVIFAIIVTISIYLCAVIIIGWQDSLVIMSKISLLGWFSLIACSFLSYLLRYYRWSYFIKKMGYSVPNGIHFSYYISGFALTVTPAKIGETIRSLYLYNHRVPYNKSISSFFIERLLDIIVVTIISSLLLFTSNEYQFFIIVLAFFLITVLILLRSQFISKNIKSIVQIIANKKLIVFLRHLNLILFNARKLLNYRSLIFGLFLGLTAWIIQGSAFYILLSYLELQLPFYIAISIYSIALLAGALSFIPGGIGTTEVVLAIFLYQFGAQQEIIILAPITIRITSLWFAVIIGLLATIFTSSRLKTN